MVDMDMQEAPAFALTENANKKDFVDRATEGTLAFARGRLRIKYGTTKNSNEHKLTLVHASPTLTETAEENPVPPGDTRILPVQLEWLGQSKTGMLAVTYPQTTQRLATGVIVCMTATKNAKTESAETGWCIKNFVTECSGAN